MLSVSSLRPAARLCCSCRQGFQLHFHRKALREVFMNEKTLPSTLDETLAPVKSGRRRFLGRMLVGAAALALLASAALTAGAQLISPPPATDMPSTPDGGTAQPSVAAPKMNPASGTYSKAQTVSISASSGNVIYYTTDGSAPSSSSAKYSGAITIPKTTTVKAKACLQSGQNMNCSSVTTETYTIKGN